MRRNSRYSARTGCCPVREQYVQAREGRIVEAADDRRGERVICGLLYGAGRATRDGLEKSRT